MIFKNLFISLLGKSDKTLHAEVMFEYIFKNYRNHFYDAT